MIRRAALMGIALAAAGGGAAYAADDAVPYFTVPEKFFSADFPGKPVVGQASFPVPTPQGTKVSVPAVTYSLQQPGASYRVTVADLANSAAADSHALDHAVEAFRKSHGALPLDAEVSHSLTGSKFQLCGRHFGYAGKDGALHYETLYYNPNTWLFYDITSTVSAKAQPEHGADAEHFQTSFAIKADAKSQLPAPPPYPDNWKLHKYPDSGFDIRFPAEPTVEQGSYTTDTGIAVPATRYWAKQGDVLYRLTVAHYNGTAADPDGTTADAQVAGAVRAWKRQGTVLADDSVAISAGQCGRDVTIARKEDGLRARASIYFPASQHRVYLLEVAQLARDVPIDPIDDRRFRESLALVLPQ